MLMLKRAWGLIRGNSMLYIGAIAAAAMATLFSMVTPVIFKITVDSVLGGAPVDTPAAVVNLIERLGGTSYLAVNLWFCALALVFFTLFNGLFSFLRTRWISLASENIGKRLKDRLYDHLQKLPYDYHVKAQTGDIIQRCTSDVETVRRFLSGQVVEMARTVFIAVFSISVMLTMSVKMTVAAVVMLPFIFIFSMVFFKKVRAAFKLTDEKEGELSTVLQESMTGIRVVRAFGRQKHEVDKYERKNSEFRDLAQKVSRQEAYFWSLSDLLCSLQNGIVLLMGVYLCVTRELTLGTLLVFTSYENMLIWPIRHMGRILSDLGKMEVSLGRVYEILNTPEEADTQGAGRPRLRGDIVFDNVSFEYEENNPVLSNVSFKIKAGETVAFLGSTGSGKSTVMHLLLRLYDYSKGSITVNGTELVNIEKPWLRERVGLVLQEPFLYSKTIKDNLKMAKDAAEDHELYAATRTASIHDDIESFEKGYETMIGERGVTLSGGQKQRVAIARTLIKNSDLLIFDDSLSAVDTETDAQIRAALKERSSDVTTFIISQRITTLMEADRILVIENGRLTDEGTHDELITRDGLYSRIWNIQNLLEDDFEDEVS